MAKKPFSIDLLVDLLKHVPEGYLEWRQIHENFDVKKMNGSWKSISKEASQSGVGCKELTFFDATRVTLSSKLTTYLTRRRQEEQDVSEARAILVSHATGIFNESQWNSLFNHRQRQCMSKR